MKSIKDLRDSFIYMESEQQLFDVESCSIKVWQYIRFSVFWELVRRFCHNTIPMRVLFPKEYDGKMHIKNLYEKYVQRNIFFAKHRDVVIVAHGRKVIENGFYRDIYTSHLDRELKISHYVLDNSGSSGKYVIQDSKNILIDDQEAFYRKFGLAPAKQKPKKDEIDRLIIRPLEGMIGHAFDYELKEFIMRNVRHVTLEHKRKTEYYSFLLQKIRPKLLVMLVSYGFDNQVFCEVAKGFHIPVVELEHGTATDCHIAYNFHDKVTLNCFPDYFFCWGVYEKEKASWPIEDERIRVVGFPEMDYNIQEYSKVHMKDGRITILFISSQQPELRECVLRLARMLRHDQYRILYKLHPMERANWTLGMKPLFEKSGIEVIYEYEKPVHYYIAMSDWVVGIQSTALFEATAFGKRIAVVNAPEAEGSRALYENGYAVLVDNVEILKQIIVTDGFKPREDDYFFARHSLSNMIHEIEQIIEENQKC